MAVAAAAIRWLEGDCCVSTTRLRFSVEPPDHDGDHDHDHDDNE